MGYAELLCKYEKLTDDNEKLKEFIRKVIKEYCWAIEDSDPLDLQELAEKLGLIVPCIATEDHVTDESDFEVGDAIFTWSDILAQPPSREEAGGEGDV
jgi:hypothetical protein